jgi:hypothetical protein
MVRLGLHGSSESRGAPATWLLALVAIVAAAGAGVAVDAVREPDQPLLFTSFLSCSAVGALLGWWLAAASDPSPVHRVASAIASLIAWRVAYFPLLVIGGWLGSVGEWLGAMAGVGSFVYPTFLGVLVAAHLAASWVAAAALASPEHAVSRPRAPLSHRLQHPPRVLLLGAGALALPVAALVSFSKPADWVWFGDGPWRERREIPPISAPAQNPYAKILREYDLALAPRVLAHNAMATYPLVPEGPWGSAMKPIATSRDRVDEHYLAYLAAHPRLHDAGAPGSPSVGSP